jgi:hypothetical protein
MKKLRNKSRRRKTNGIYVYLNTKTRESYRSYKRQREMVKNLVIEAKKRSWEEFGEKM